MTIFDDIRKDREGSDDDWVFDETNIGKSFEWAWQLRTEFGGIPVYIDCSDRFNRDRTFEDFARRIARVPRLERIALAAEELAGAADWLSASKDAYLKSGVADNAERFILAEAAFVKSFAAFRAACGEGE